MVDTFRISGGTHRLKQNFPSERVYWQDSVLPSETDFSKATDANKKKKEETNSSFHYFHLSCKSDLKPVFL